MNKIAGILIAFSFLLPGCGKDETTQPSGNQAPDAASNPIPAHRAAGVSCTPALSWTCSDPDPGDTVKYDIYFGPANPPHACTVPDWMLRNYAMQGLDTNRTYYWRIKAKDSKGASSTGPVWRFSTAAPPPAQDLVAGYAFDGNTADNSGNGHAGTAVNSPGFGTDRFNDARSALRLDGEDQYASLPHSISIEHDISISFWMKTDLSDDGSWPFATFLIDRDLCTSTGDWSVGLGLGGRVQWNTGTNLLSSARSVNDDSWMHVVVLRDAAGRSKKIFINGDQDTSASFSNESFANDSIGIYVGASVCDTRYHHYYRGLIDDIRLYDRVLSEAEVRLLFYER